MPDTSVTILFSDPEFVVAIKPVGVPYEGKTGDTPDFLTLLGDTLQAQGTPSALYPVHRLDQTVGGVTVVAKTSRAAARLSVVFSTHAVVSKTYLAVAEGTLPPEGEYLHYLRRDPFRARAVVFDKPSGDARQARLAYRVLGVCEEMGAPVSLISVSLFTGRFHQIRAQLSHVGHPLVGDGKYHAKLSALAPALYAYSLSFPHPADGRLLSFCAPVPDTYPFSLFDPSLFDAC